MSRLLNALHKILRVKQHDIDQLRQQVALLTEQIALRQLAIEKNISHVNTERLIASVNIKGSDTLEVFVTQKMQQNKQYQEESEELQRMVTEMQEKLYNAYVEQKQFEKVKNSEQIKIDNEEKRKEMQVIDEIARQININNLTKD